MLKLEYMKLAVLGNEESKQEFLLKKTAAAVTICFVDAPPDVPADADAVIDLSFVNTPATIALLEQSLPLPVFINAVTETLAEIDRPFIRLNAWSTFLSRDITEVVVQPQQQEAVHACMEQLGWKYQAVPDMPGMVSARVISMLINEAYFALEEKISTREEIDIAMKAGTSYPYGPFEWSRKIGLARIYHLLARLCKENDCYQVAALLQREATISERLIK